MSGEQITVKEISNAAKIDNVRKKLPPKFENRVDINELLSKVRKEKKQEKKENYIFLILIFGVVAVTGILASL